MPNETSEQRTDMLSTVEECFDAIGDGWDFEVQIDGERPG